MWYNLIDVVTMDIVLHLGLSLFGLLVRRYFATRLMSATATSGAAR
jgi:hypothetical protein